MTALTAQQVETFVNDGLLRLPGCLSPDVIDPLVSRAWQRLSVDPDDPATWDKEIAYLDHETRLPVRDVAPHAWAAICQLLGGEEQIEPRPIPIGRSFHFQTVESTIWSDAFIINFHRDATGPAVPPSAQTPGWHKDGSYFRHFLDSPEQSLLTLIYWSDVQPGGGGTLVARDSIGPVARYLRDHPEGIDDGCGHLVSQCTQFEELAARAGDVFLVHPFMLHASSPNRSGRPRVLSNPSVARRDPFRFDRRDGRQPCPVELATLRALDVDELEFTPTRARRFYGPGE